jgi:hypothetical protein
VHGPCVDDDFFSLLKAEEGETQGDLPVVLLKKELSQRKTKAPYGRDVFDFGGFWDMLPMHRRPGERFL